MPALPENALNDADGTSDPLVYIFTHDFPAPVPIAIVSFTVRVLYRALASSAFAGRGLGN